MTIPLALTGFAWLLLLQFICVANKDPPMALFGLLPIQLLGAVGYSWEFA